MYKSSKFMSIMLVVMLFLTTILPNNVFAGTLDDKTVIIHIKHMIPIDPAFIVEEFDEDEMDIDDFYVESDISSVSENDINAKDYWITTKIGDEITVNADQKVIDKWDSEHTDYQISAESEEYTIEFDEEDFDEEELENVNTIYTEISLYYSPQEIQNEEYIEEITKSSEQSEEATKSVTQKPQNIEVNHVFKAITPFYTDANMLFSEEDDITSGALMYMDDNGALMTNVYRYVENINVTENTLVDYSSKFVEYFSKGGYVVHFPQKVYSDTANNGKITYIYTLTHKNDFKYRELSEEEKRQKEEKIEENEKFAYVSTTIYTVDIEKDGVSYTITGNGEQDDMGITILKVNTKIPVINIPEYFTINGIDIPITEIGQGCFENNTVLEKIKFNKHIDTIGNRAFKGCIKLKNLKLPENLLILGDSCFNGCKQLSIVNIPSTVNMVGDYCFANCSNLLDLNLSSSMDEIPKGMCLNCKNLYDVTVLDSIKEIDKDAFKNCKSIDYIYGMNNVEQISDSAFESCQNLTKVTIKQNTKKINKKAFYNCKKLKKVNIKSQKLKQIGKYAFTKTNKKMTIYVPQGKETTIKKLLRDKKKSKKVKTETLKGKENGQ